MPLQPGPHGILPPPSAAFSFTPDQWAVVDPGATIIYTHSLFNTGNITNSYDLTWTSTQPWSTVFATTTIELLTGQEYVVTVTVNVPNNGGVLGQHDTTIIIATSTFSPTSHLVADFTLVPTARIFLPVILR
jgi:uncharacterized repeat protein (TIGR01451 family)